MLPLRPPVLPITLPASAGNSNANIVPTVANGKVYVASDKQLDIFGLLPSRGALVANTAWVTGAAAVNPAAVTCPASEPASAGVASGLGIHQVYGTVCRANGQEMQLALRNGRSISVEVSQALARRRVLLTPGRPVRVQLTVDPQGAAHASRIFPAHVLSPVTPADR